MVWGLQKRVNRVKFKILFVQYMLHELLSTYSATTQQQESIIIHNPSGLRRLFPDPDHGAQGALSVKHYMYLTS